MGHWGVRSYEVDEADEALDAAFASVHGRTYDELMSDRNPMPVEEVRQRLANPETLDAALSTLRGTFGEDLDGWDEIGRLALAGVVVLHVELGVPVPIEVRERAASWLELEDLDWEPQPKRDARRRREVERPRRPEPTGEPPGPA